jgi:hypothetical protein
MGIAEALAGIRLHVWLGLKGFACTLVIQLVLALLINVVDGDRWLADDKASGDSALNEVLYLVTLTWVGGSYGDVTPSGSFGARLLVGVVSAAGYLFQLFLLALVVEASTALKAGRPPAANDGVAKFVQLLPFYGLALGGLLLLAMLFAVVTEKGTDEDDPSMGFGSKFYLLWMTFHGTTYGEVLPTTDIGRCICCLTMLLNYWMMVYWVALATMPAVGGMVDTLKSIRPHMTLALLGYAISTVAQFVWAIIINLVDGDRWLADDKASGDSAYDEVLYLVALTWVGGSYGDIYPSMSFVPRLLVGVVSAAGYLFQLFLLALVVEASTALKAGRPPAANDGLAKFVQLLPFYGLALGGLLLLAMLFAVVTEERDGEVMDFGSKFYLLWMTFHGTTYGEVSPFNFLGRTICYLAMLSNYFLTVCWVAGATMAGAGALLPGAQQGGAAAYVAQTN